MGVDRRLPGGRDGEQRHLVLARGPEGRTVHRAVQSHRHAHRVPAEHHRVHGGDPLRAGRDHQGRGQVDQRGLQFHRAPRHADGGRELRRGELRHGGPRLRPALRLHVAQSPHRGDGPQAARRRSLDRAAQRGGGSGTPVRRGRRRGTAPGDRGPDRGGVDGAVRDRAVVGRRDHRSPRYPDRARHRPHGRALGPRAGNRGLRLWCGTDGRTATHPPRARGQPGRDRPPGHPGGARRRVRGDRGVRGRRRREPLRRRGGRSRAAPRRDARRDLPRPRGAGAGGGGGGRGRAPSRLRIPLGGSGTGRGVRGGRHRLGGAARPGDADHGPQGAGQAGRGRGGRARASRCRRGRRA